MSDTKSRPFSVKGRLGIFYWAGSAVIFVFLLEAEIIKSAVDCVQKVLERHGFSGRKFLNVFHYSFLLTLLLIHIWIGENRTRRARAY